MATVRTSGRRRMYVYGNTVTKPEPGYRELPRRGKTSAQVQKNRRRVRQLNAAYVLFLFIATVAAVIVCVHYLQLKAEMSQHSRNITTLQEELVELTEKNDTAYNAATDTVNRDELEQRAVQLGMTYPTDGQVIKYSSPDSDYVKQYDDIPKSGALAQSADVSK